jgi:GT2 family glycosyltransferase
VEKAIMVQKKVSVIIVSYNVRYFLELCLDSVSRAVEGIDAEIIVVDNNSGDDSCALVRKKFPDVILLANADNKGFSKANNQGLAASRGEYIHFLNPDTVVPEDFYRESLRFMDEHKEAGCLGPRLVDGRGMYAPDSKKSFPSFRTSVFKVMGLSRLFPKSTLFNKYYAAHIGERQTAAVDILSGCCLLVRASAMKEAGGGFDEAYFMYCEDVDLCHRIKEKGYKNYYFPEVSVIHYKGESTRKLSYRYMRIFYDAHALFVKKYYPKRLGAIYIAALRMVLALRNFVNWGRHLFSLFKMYLLDAILLTIVTLLVKEFWFENIGRIPTTDPDIIWSTLPVFILIWLSSMYLNGAYDKPFSLFKTGRGMLLGTLLVLAGYALLPVGYRFSRGVVLFSGISGAVVLLIVRWLLSLLNWIKLVPRGKIDYKAAIVSHKPSYKETVALLERARYNLDIMGRIAVNQAERGHSLGTVADLPAIREIYRINELIFDSTGCAYKDIIANMERCAPKSFFKIHVSGSEVLVGSNNSRHHADEFSLEQRYEIGTAEGKRNKRIVDIFSGLVLLLGSPLFLPRVKNKSGFIANIFQVLAGKKTWVGYKTGRTNEAVKLPVLKPAVLPPYQIPDSYNPDEENKWNLYEQYARHYSTLDDLRIIWVNFPYLGDKKI